MSKKCVGCGALLQYDKLENAGYIEPEMYEKVNLCRRCFRFKCYGDYVFIKKDTKEYYTMLKDINDTNDLVLYVIDVFNLNNSLMDIRKYLNNPMILVLNKSDILPPSIKTSKIIKWLEKYNLNMLDIVSISSEKNYQLDSIYRLINKHRKTKDVYFVGHTNAGKSTLINKLTKLYSRNEANITTSILPSTTLEKMSIELNDKLTLIDTPGLVDEGNIINYVDYITLKKIMPHNIIKPITYQLEPGQSLIINNLATIEYIEGERNSFTIFISSDCKIERVSIKNNEHLHKLKKKVLNINENEDLVINGLCWIKIVKKANLNIYTLEKVEVYSRTSLI